MSAPDKVRAALSEGPATTSELQAEFSSVSGKRSAQLKGALIKMRRRGEIRRRPMIASAGRREVVKPLMVWELTACQA